MKRPALRLFTGMPTMRLTREMEKAFEQTVARKPRAAGLLKKSL